MMPGDQIHDDAGLERAIDQQVASFRHAISTVPMGGDHDEWAVVDGADAVRGIGNLRVIDAPRRGALRPGEPDRDHGGRAHLPACALPLSPSSRAVEWTR